MPLNSNSSSKLADAGSIQENVDYDKEKRIEVSKIHMTHGLIYYSQGTKGGHSTIEVIAGRLVLKDQLHDYKFRGDALQSMNFLDFMMNTYEGNKDGGTENEGEIGDGNEPNGRRRGRQMNERVDYLPEGKKGNRCRIIRSNGHETLPRIVGKWFGRDDSELELERNQYYASMLLLLKPWTDLQKLKADNESFETSFKVMVAEGNEKIHRVLHNIQYYYECEDGARARREEERKNPGSSGRQMELEVELGEADLIEYEEEGSKYEDGLRVITEEEIELARITKTAPRERLSAEAAIWQAFDSGIFTNNDDSSVEWKPHARRTDVIEMHKIREWEKQLKETTRQLICKTGSADLSSSAIVSAGFTAEAHLAAPAPGSTGTCEPIVEMMEDFPQTKPRLERDILNEEQRQAHDIIEEKLLAIMESELIIKG